MQGAHFEADNHFCYHSGIVADKVRIIGRSTEDPGNVQEWESTAPFASWRLWSSTLCSMPSLTCVSIKIVYNSHRKTHIAAVEDTVAKVREINYIIAITTIFVNFMIIFIFTNTCRYTWSKKVVVLSSFSYQVKFPWLTYSTTQPQQLFTWLEMRYTLWTTWSKQSISGWPLVHSVLIIYILGCMVYH